MKNHISKVILGVIIGLTACSTQSPSPSTNQDQASSSAGEKYGLSEAERKRILEEIFQLWIKAGNESNKKYPFIIYGEKTDIGENEAASEKANELEQLLMKKYISEVARDCTPSFLAVTNVPTIKHPERSISPRSCKSRAKASKTVRNVPSLETAVASLVRRESLG